MLAVFIPVSSAAATDPSDYSIAPDLDTPNTISWSYDTLDSGVVSNGSFSGMIKFLVFTWVYGRCSRSNTAAEMSKNLNGDLWGTPRVSK